MLRTLMVALAVIASAATAAMAEAPVRGGTLVVALEPEPSRLYLSSQTAVIVQSQIYDTLVTLDDDFKPRPRLAERWDISPDGKTITFHLRQDVKWHDGKPFTSADVAYSILELNKKHHSRGLTNFGAITAIDTPDAHTAVFRLSAPSLALWAAFGGDNATIVPKHLWEGTDPFTNAWINKPVGTGPFIFKEWMRGDHITLERNPDYWEKGKPHLDRILFRVIPDAGARAAGLETGQVHYVPVTPVPLSDVDRLRKLQNIEIVTYGFGTFAPMYLFDFNLEKPVFKDIRVRQAFAHAIDKKALAAVAWYGFAKPASTPVPSVQKQFFATDTQQYAYDPAKAERLLDEAGYKRGKDGVRFRITHLPVAYGEDFRRSAEFIRQQLKRVGIEEEIVNYDLAGWLRKVFAERDFDTMTAYYAANADPQIGVHRRFWSKTFNRASWTNGSGYQNPEMDKVIEASHAEADPVKRAELLREFQRIAQRDLPSITLLEVSLFGVKLKRLHGLDTGPDGVYGSYKDAWLDQ
ncbi:peptide/nickel transport system substrate-binding protein [Bradyrhizobium sp. AZCC 2262]|uniref:ABC transporter substrate-binding protein n=1 Tax=Bradyrhizobium sp. AZCC 2262 TaxID=3117022 RepID=UPI002FF403B6